MQTKKPKKKPEIDSKKLSVELLRSNGVIGEILTSAFREIHFETIRLNDFRGKYRFNDFNEKTFVNNTNKIVSLKIAIKKLINQIIENNEWGEEEVNKFLEESRCLN